MQNSARTGLARQVALNPQDIAEIKRIVGLIAPDEETLARRARANESEPKSLLAEARRLHQHRRMREQFFDKQVLGDAPWDILLVLYYDKNWRTLSITSVGAEAGVSPTTALRWLNFLRQQGLIDWFAHSTDARIKLLTLTDKARTAMDHYFSRILQDG